MNKTLRISLSIIFVVLYILICLIPTNSMTVSALNISVDGGYTTALEDLSTDENFNTEDYPIVQDDYSLQVIQIAESSDKELFVYIYQPSADYCNLKATTINISCALHKSQNIKNYKLTLLNSSGVFYKYIVNDLTVSNETTRYYEVISIFRKWNSSYDAPAPNGNIISEISFNVGKQYIFKTNENGLLVGVTETDVETITILNKYVGFVRYKENNAPDWLDRDYFDSHFVAFSTDKPIEKLFEAELYYSKQENWDSSADIFDYVDEFGKIETGQYAYLNYEQDAIIHSNDWQGVWTSNTYEYNRIQSINDFLDDETNRENAYSNPVFNSVVQSKLTDQGLQDLNNMQWVLRFAETDYNYSRKVAGSDQFGYYFTTISDVTILRLKFETEGVVYDLGVVDNKQTGDGIPDNETKIDYEINDMFKIILLLFLIVILVVVLGPVLPTIISILLWVVKFVLKIVVWLISLPFKLLGKIFGKRE